MAKTTAVLLSALVAASGLFTVNAQSSSAAAVPTSATGVITSSTAATATVDTSGLPASAVATSLPYSFSIPDLASITANAPTASTVPLDSTYSAGSTPTAVTNAPPIPTAALVVANYPALDVVPPVNSTEVQQWLSELDLSSIPDYNVTTGACATSAAAVADKDRCWWTCGGCTRSTDITVCPDKLDWGLSYDDGPSPYTPLLLDYLNENDIKTTFFVVGSRVLSRPAMVVAEYMSGHQISVHTWSHPYLTTLTNEQIVAELGWTKKVIKDTIGVTPRTFRPPYGDIDDRVRAIAAQMGMTPIIWTTANGVIFDTDDWNIPGGTATGATSLARFETILETAQNISTGFIVLEHDLYQQTVELAVGYVLPMAISAKTYALKSINQCLGWDNSEAYIETASNDTTIDNPAASSGTSFPVTYNTGVAAAVETSAGVSATTTGTSGSMSTSVSGSSASKTSTAAATSSTASTGGAGKQAVMNAGFGGLAALVAVGMGATLLL